MLRGSSTSAFREPHRPAAVLVTGLVLLAALTGCGVREQDPEPTPTPSATTTDTSRVEPEFIPDGTAEDNLPLFTRVTEQVWASDARVSGRAYIDALVAAGFDRDRMQVTEDSSTVGNPAESLQFSVAWGEDECLMGQVGPSTGEPVTMVMDQLSTGQCLIGTTRDIDW